MTARDLIAAARAGGADLEPNGDRLRWRGPLTDFLRGAMADHKASVLAVLRAEAGLCSGCGASLGLQGRTVRLAIVEEDGSTQCQDCFIGLTALRRAGVPA